VETRKDRWYTVVEDVRTWLLKNPNSYQPEIDWPSMVASSAPRNAAVAKSGSGALSNRPFLVYSLQGID